MSLTVRLRADGATEFVCEPCQMGVAVMHTGHTDLLPEPLLSEARAQAVSAAVSAGCPHQGADPLVPCPVPGCNVKVCRDDLGPHWQEAHFRPEYGVTIRSEVE